jgi:hypothetical protein
LAPNHQRQRQSQRWAAERQIPAQRVLLSDPPGQRRFDHPVVVIAAAAARKSLGRRYADATRPTTKTTTLQKSPKEWFSAFASYGVQSVAFIFSGSRAGISPWAVMIMSTGWYFVQSAAAERVAASEPANR